MKKQEENIDQAAKRLAKQLEPLIQQMNKLYDDAIIAYTPLVYDICCRQATENEVEWLLTWMLDFAGDERMLHLYKRVCRAYWKKHPESIAFYIMEYRREYDPESLKGTKYEYLLNEDDKVD